MTKRARRNHTPTFKAKVALAAIKGGRRWRNWRSSLTSILTRSRNGAAQLLGGAAGVFGRNKAEAAAPAVDLKALHAKIGELALENDFLSGALGKAGLLSAKR